MGAADREYSRDGPRAGGGFLSQLTPIVKGLLIANIAIFFVDMIFFDGGIRRFGMFTIPSAMGEGRVWELLTFQFIHDERLGHLLFNSIGLFFFGPWMERYWGSRRFLAFYLLCGVAGALLYSVLAVMGILESRGLVGASAGIYGILAGVAVVAPNLRVALLFPPIELSMKQLAIALLTLAVVMIVLPFGLNRGGEAGHLGGALLGFLLVKCPRLLGWAERRERGLEIVRPKAFQRRSEAKLRPRTKFELEEASEVDRLLDKISQQGFQSLTEKEREVLLRASKSKQPD